MMSFYSKVTKADLPKISQKKSVALNAALTGKKRRRIIDDDESVEEDEIVCIEAGQSPLNSSAIESDISFSRIEEEEEHSQQMDVPSSQQQQSPQSHPPPPPPAPVSAENLTYDELEDDVDDGNNRRTSLVYISREKDTVPSIEELQTPKIRAFSGVSFF